MIINRQDFWQFSLSTYARPSVAAYCLQLQDERQANINMLLLCLYCGQQKISINSSLCATLLEHTQSWRRQCIEPLQYLRQQFKSMEVMPVPVYEAIKETELQAEAQEQAMLMDYMQSCSEPAILEGLLENVSDDMAATNLIAYKQTLPSLSDWDVSELLLLLVVK